MLCHARRNKNQKRAKSLEFERLETREVLSVAGISTSDHVGGIDTSTLEPPSAQTNSSEPLHAAPAATHDLSATDCVLASYRRPLEATPSDLDDTSRPSHDQLDSALPTFSSAVGAGLSSATASRGTQLTDAEIGSMIAAKDETGLRALLENHGGRVKNHLRKRFLISPADADAALNEGAYRVWKYFDPSRGMSVGAYFVMASDSAAKDILRSINKHRENVGLSAAIEPTQREQGLAFEERSDLKDAVLAALSELTVLERATIRADLEADGKASNKELASAFDVTSSAVTHARSSAHDKLGRLLAEFDPRCDS